jgi:hypothetical protein
MAFTKVAALDKGYVEWMSTRTGVASNYNERHRGVEVLTKGRSMAAVL